MISDERLLDFCRALEAAVRSGLPLGAAFETLAKARAHGRLLAKAAGLTAQGLSIHEALAAQKIFPPVFLALIRAGEAGGKLDDFLALFAGSLEVRIEFGRRVRRALFYPVFAALLAAALFLALTLKAIPFILGPLTLAGPATAAPAHWLADVIVYARGHWPALAGAGLAALLVLRALAGSGLGRKLWALAAHWLPGLRYVTAEARFYDVYATMGLLLKAGLRPGAMMDVLLQYAKDDPLTKRRFLRAAGMVANGVNFSNSFNGFIPGEDFVAMEMGERTGRLEETLARLGKTHCDAHLHRLKVMTTGITIAATVALAPLCFLLIMSLIKPVLSAVGGITGADGAAADAGQAAPAQPAPESASPAGSADPAGQGAAPKGIFPLRYSYDAAADTATAAFNEVQAAKIRAVMRGLATPEGNNVGGGRGNTERGESLERENAVRPGSQARPAGSAASESSSSPDSAASPGNAAVSPPAPVKKKLGPVPRIKNIQIKNVGATPIQPAEVGK